MKTQEFSEFVDPSFIRQFDVFILHPSQVVKKLQVDFWCNSFK